VSAYHHLLLDACILFVSITAFFAALREPCLVSLLAVMFCGRLQHVEFAL
jgi:hypothetical protein